MPKRHNTFQDLIGSIHQQLASSYRVTESEMLKDLVSGQEREVDLVIRSYCVGYEIVISIECTDRSRLASVQWVEEGKGKVVMNGVSKKFKAGDAFVVPQGTKHNVINTSKTKMLKLYTIYTPPNHRDGVVHKTKKAAEADKTDKP